MTNSQAAESAESEPMAEPGRPPAMDHDALLAYLRGRDDPAEPVSAPEIADTFGVGRRTALRYLHDLEDDDRVDSKPVGGRAKVFWLPTPQLENADSGDTVDEPAEDPVDVDHDPAERRESLVATDQDTRDRSVSDDSADRQDDQQALERAVALLEGTEPWADQDVHAETASRESRRAVEWLADDGGRRTQSDFLDALPFGRGVWERAVRPALNELADAGLLEYRTGHYDYRWVGDRAGGTDE